MDHWSHDELGKNTCIFKKIQTISPSMVISEKIFLATFTKHASLFHLARYLLIFSSSFLRFSTHSLPSYERRLKSSSFRNFPSCLLEQSKAAVRRIAINPSGFLLFLVSVHNKDAVGLHVRNQARDSPPRVIHQVGWPPPHTETQLQASTHATLTVCT